MHKSHTGLMVMYTDSFFLPSSYHYCFSLYFKESLSAGEYWRLQPPTFFFYLYYSREQGDVDVQSSTLSLAVNLHMGCTAHTFCVAVLSLARSHSGERNTALQARILWKSHWNTVTL